MSDEISAKVDVSGVLKGLGDLANPETLNSLCRSMCVAAGKIFRDEAKIRAPVGENTETHTAGLLRDSIYLAYKTRSPQLQPTYSVTWNSKKAPHGHLVEFGHLQPFKVYKGADGQWYTSTTLLDSPKFVPAHPFLRPAYEAVRGIAQEAMIKRGRERLAELIAGGSNELGE